MRRVGFASAFDVGARHKSNMALDHEYALLGGMNRAKVGRYLALLAAATSAGAVVLSSGLGFWLESKGWPRAATGWIATTVSAGVAWAVLYWVLDRHAWRWPLVGTALGVPDLSGDWIVEGLSLNPDAAERAWSGTATISQRWDKIHVRIDTAQSRSDSLTAALLCEPGGGHRLLYTYRNSPKIKERELQAHRGSADLLFAADRKSADGEYFNGQGRFTFGTLTLTRKNR